MNIKTIIVFICVIIILAMGIGSWKWENEKNANRALVTKAKEGEIKNEEAGNVGIGDWKTYKNEGLGIEFKYPKEFQLALDNGVVRLHKDCSVLKDEEISVQMKCDLENDISFGTSDKDLKSFIEYYNGEYLNGVPLTRISSQEDYSLDNIQGKALEGTTAEDAGGNDYIFVTKNNKNYLISFNKNSDINLKIISTFRFID